VYVETYAKGRTARTAKERERERERERTKARNTEKEKEEVEESLKAKWLGCAPCITIILGKS
jgi:ribosomal protein L9